MGSLLAQAGYAVATGGYKGVMAAASQGAAEAGGHVIGVTTARLDHWRANDGTANQWVHEEIKFPNLKERLYHLIEFSQAAVALRGGIGTLTEVALTWSLLQVGEIAPRPFILVGSSWHEQLERYYGEGAYIEREQMSLWRCVDTPEEVVAALGVAG